MIIEIGLTPCHTSVLILCLSGEVGIDIVPLPSPCITESFRLPNRPPPTIIGGEGNGWGAGALIEVRGEGMG